MKSVIKTLLIIISLYGILFLTNARIFAQDNLNSKYTLYVLDSCPHCQKLLEEAEPSGVLEILEVTVIEVTPDENKQLLLNDLETCNDNDQIVPTLVVDSTCYQGASDIERLLFANAGIALPLDEPTEVQDPNDTEQPNDSENLPDSTKLDTSTEENTTTDNATTSDEEPIRLSEVLDEEKNTYERPEVSAFQLLIIILSIGTFLFIGYLMIKKLQL